MDAKEAFEAGKELARTGVLKKTVPEEVERSWHEKAGKIKNTEELKSFLDYLLDQNHDYSSIAEAFISGLKATMRAMDSHKNGGITGFQAGFVLSQFLAAEKLIRGPWQIRRFENMLYPQYENHFDKTVSKDTWIWLQTEAARLLLKDDVVNISPIVIDHWDKIAHGIVPFGYEVREEI